VDITTTVPSDTSSTSISLRVLRIRLLTGPSDLEYRAAKSAIISFFTFGVETVVTRSLVIDSSVEQSLDQANGYSFLQSSCNLSWVQIFLSSCILAVQRLHVLV